MTGTADRLLQAAIDLLVEQGPAATTLRAITDRAGANVAAVGYHFGSKDALVTEAYAEILAQVTRTQLDRLAALPENADLAAVVRVWVGPAFATGDGDVREAALWRAVQHGMAEQAPALLAHRDTVAVVEDELHRRLHAFLPHLDEPELRFRHAATLAAIGSLRTDSLRHLMPEHAHASQLLELVVTWIAGGLRAPAAPPLQP